MADFSLFGLGSVFCLGTAALTTQLKVLLQPSILFCHLFVGVSSPYQPCKPTSLVCSFLQEPSLLFSALPPGCTRVPGIQCSVGVN